MRALIVCNANDNDPGYVGEAFEAFGYRMFRAHREDHASWAADLVDDCDQLILLGSDWSVYWDQVGPAVSAEVALIHQAVAAGVPTFGVCFGAQLLTVALGGSVVRSPLPEIGWCDVGSVHPDVESGPWMQWHYDVCQPPAGVQMLAANAIGPQAFRQGRAMATQFHPEATPKIVTRWSSGGGGEELARLAIDREELLARVEHEAPRTRLAAHQLVERYCAGV